MCCSGFFVFFATVKLRPFKRIPGWITLGVVSLACILCLFRLDFFERLERMTYDMRVREALKFASPVATNLGLVFINEDSVKSVWNGSLGYSFGLYWPRQVYGRLLEEMASQGARAVAFDIIFGELRPDHPPVRMADRSYMESDDFFALQLQHSRNGIIALTKEVTPPDPFLTNALAAGDITTEKDPDGILRWVQAFRVYTNWHLAFRKAEKEFGLDLDKARVEPGQILLRQGKEIIRVPLDSDGNFDLADFVGEKIPPGMARKDKPFTTERAWHMGVVLGARELGLDLARAEVDLPHGRITLRGLGGVERIIPVDSDGHFYIDWCLPPEDPRLTKEAIQELLLQDRLRLEGKTGALTNRWRNKLVVVGSSGVIGNNLSDRGATPFAKDTLLVSKHWNVASSIITGRFVRRASLTVDLAIVAALCLAAALLTWQSRPIIAFAGVLLLAASYVVLGVVLYVFFRYWIPLVLPVFSGLLTNVCLVTWRVVFEQAERRRVKSIFSKIVSPKIVNELLAAETLSLGGARRQITVFFADVREFSFFTDLAQERVSEYVRQHRLTGQAAESCVDEQARETLNTVNLYLGLVADMVIKQDGTLDKFIGDCVMAFWGAPTPNLKHALSCVRAAIDAQRAVCELNRQRAGENKKREFENLARVSAGLPPRPFLPILFLGSGINTGMATVGLMGSQAHTSNYTVFGREVNLASRLESASGRGRIFISETTYQHLLRDDSALAATCTALPAHNLKGFLSAVKVFEVPWRPPGSPPLDEEFPPGAVAEGASFTGFIQRGSL